MDFKVKCVKYVEPVSERKFTINKVYDVTSNKIVSDDGTRYTAWSLPENGDSDFKALKNWFSQWYVFEFVGYKYQIGDHVVIERSNIEESHPRTGQTGVVTSIDEYRTGYNYRVRVDNTNVQIYCRIAGYAEDKNVFTKKDLKNGDFVLRRNGDVEVFIESLGVFLDEGGFQLLSEIKDDLTSADDTNLFDIIAVRRPRTDRECNFKIFDGAFGDLVYERKSIPELTADEIYEKYGVRVKLEKE